jgi:hypothetical protein
MSRLIRERIPVWLSSNGQSPVAFVWEGRRYAVQWIELIWKECGGWWDGHGERTHFLVRATSCDQTGVYELHFDHESGTWRLGRVLD